ncbi:contractile injection system tape measure protein [Ulvibacter antarcticus]|uniref:Uncharacterized protein n=1 Tax=Ulvibacter antarcticus TaxID=442714 RepID=A0A3L9YDT3_9FLAO|nr:contractile injection system tape measure protein [Ulvibacter antarcticus]RMA58863.1 hypothetical protein BXY75_2243 [Ulvibacter antarcticus]
MEDSKHIINAVYCEVNAPNLITAYYLKDTIDVFLKEQIFPEIEAYFDQLLGKNRKQIFRFNKFNLNVNFDSSRSLKQLKPAILGELKKQIIIENNLGEIVESANVDQVSIQKSAQKAFLFFLENGTYPWWFDDSFSFSETQIVMFLESKTFKAQLRQSLRNESVRKRLIFQFDEHILLKISLGLISERTSEKSLKKISILLSDRLQFWEILLKNIADNKTQVLSEVKKEIDEKIKNTIDSPATSEEKKIEGKIDVSETADLEELEREGILVNNAGLILLHPFLNPFFEKLGFISGKEIISSKLQEAVHVLHYLATKEENAFEHKLTMEKYICGLPLKFPIERHFKLTEIQKEECEELLRSVLGHWDALKSSSVDILRNEFIQREGKLYITNEKHKLFVQRKPYDLLLDKIPWNISIVKIPWKKKIVFVEW